MFDSPEVEKSFLLARFVGHMLEQPPWLQQFLFVPRHCTDTEIDSACPSDWQMRTWGGGRKVMQQRVQRHLTGWDGATQTGADRTMGSLVSVRGCFMLSCSFTHSCSSDSHYTGPFPGCRLWLLLFAQRAEHQWPQRRVAQESKPTQDLCQLRGSFSSSSPSSPLLYG